MTTPINKKIRRKSRKRRSALIKGSKERPRVVLSESNRYLRVQAIDDTMGHTLLHSSTSEFAEEISNYSRKNKIYAKKLGEMFADKLKKEGGFSPPSFFAMAYRKSLDRCPCSRPQWTF